MTSEKKTAYKKLTPKESSFVHRTYEEWENSFDETAVDFINRKKAIDLSLLLNEVINNELSKTESTVIQLYWFCGMNFSSISKELKQNRTTVLRTLERANTKIYDSLKYVVRCQYDIKDDECFPIAVKKAFACLAAERASAAAVGERIAMLRKSEEINIFSFAKAISVEPQRLFNIESGNENIDIDILIALSGFFCVGTDFILFGQKGEADEKIAM